MYYIRYSLLYLCLCVCLVTRSLASDLWIASSNPGWDKQQRSSAFWDELGTYIFRDSYDGVDFLWNLYTASVGDINWRVPLAFFPVWLLYLLLYSLDNSSNSCYCFSATAGLGYRTHLQAQVASSHTFRLRLATLECSADWGSFGCRPMLYQQDQRRAPPSRNASFLSGSGLTPGREQTMFIFSASVLERI